MIVAGPCGSGKSSILQAAYKERFSLFGPDYEVCFRDSCQDPSYGEYSDYKTALQKQSFFQARHVRSLMLEDSLPRLVLLHVDLYQILLGIDPSSFPRSLRIRETLRAFGQVKELKISAFLQSGASAHSRVCRSLLKMIKSCVHTINVRFLRVLSASSLIQFIVRSRM